MVKMDEMNKLMDDDIIQDEERKLCQFSIENKVSRRGATSSSTTSSRYLDRIVG